MTLSTPFQSQVDFTVANPYYTNRTTERPTKKTTKRQTPPGTSYEKPTKRKDTQEGGQDFIIRSFKECGKSEEKFMKQPLRQDHDDHVSETILLSSDSDASSSSSASTDRVKEKQGVPGLSGMKGTKSPGRHGLNRGFQEQGGSPSGEGGSKLFLKKQDRITEGQSTRVEVSAKHLSRKAASLIKQQRTVARCRTTPQLNGDINKQPQPEDQLANATRQLRRSSQQGHHSPQGQNANEKRLKTGTVDDTGENVVKDLEYDSSTQINDDSNSMGQSSSEDEALPLQLVTLPRRNPFLYPNAELHDDGEGQHMEMAEDIIPRRTAKLITAQESGFFDTNVETGREAAAVRVAAGAIYFRWHLLAEADLRELLIADRIRTKSPLYSIIRNDCMRHQSVYQNKTTSWYKQGVGATIEAMGGMGVFENATSEERQNVWRALFEREPFRMAKASMPAFHLSVDVRGIYHTKDPRAQKWRRYIKTCFVWMAEDTFTYRFARNDDEAAFSNWKKMPTRRVISDLDLGDTFDVPVRHGGMYDLDRRQVGAALVNNPTYRIEDDI